MLQSVLIKINAKRLERKYSQSYMAAQLNISQSYYNKLENGNAEPSFSKVIQITKVLDISVTELFDSEGDKSV